MAVVLGIVCFLGALTLGFCSLIRRLKRRRAIRERTDGNEISNVESLQYTLREISAATNNFSSENKVGRGGFGDVYKGILANGQEVAVKRLSKRSGQGDREFKNEVAVLAKLQHINLVRLVGFCLDGEERILIYEFVPNKSLDNFLFDPKYQGRKQLFDWSRRYRIIKGIAQGLIYLHVHSRLRIIHRDLKAGNVLLDKDMNPKISDFGMARIFGQDQHQANTKRVVGTFGYMAPEYLIHGQFSTKSDVFSFGVLILEVISGRRTNSFHRFGASENLLSYAWKLFRDGRPLDLVDPDLGDSIARNEVILCINVGLLCVQEDPDKRPTMTSLLSMLTNESSIGLRSPHPPAFLVGHDKDTMPNRLELDGIHIPCSANEVSISELHPR